MNGNITKEGIKADFEWMKRSGIAGFQNFDAALNTPQIVARTNLGRRMLQREPLPERQMEQMRARSPGEAAPAAKVHENPRVFW